MICCIYKLTNLINNKIYIGKTKDFKRRCKEYKYRSRNLNKHSKYLIMEEINKYGFDNFRIDILEECDYTDLDYKEKYWINVLHARDPEIGYNSKEGGIGGKMMPYSIYKMSESSKAFKHSEETKLKMSKPIFVLQGGNVFPFDSAKKYADLIHRSRSEVSGAIKRGIRINKCYVFYQNRDERFRVMKKIYNKKSNGNKKAIDSLSEYMMAYALLEESVKCRD